MNKELTIKTTTTDSTENLSAVVKLTALWGLAESGLGGIMFAFRIPFTGFLIGAVAIIILSLIARFSNHSYRQIISSTIIVLMVKAAVSPHSPLPAYFAVAFQGFMAAILFSKLPSHKLACVLLGILSMVESSLQKVIVLTLLFGNSVWEATNNLGRETAKTFSITADHNYALWLIAGHAFIYALWGAAVGLFAADIPEKIQRQKDLLIKNYNSMKATDIVTPQTAKKRKRKRWMAYVLILVFIILVFILSGANTKQIATIILRSVAAVLLLIFVVQPLLKFLFRKWLRKRTENEQAKSQEVIQMLPALRSFVPDAYALSKTQTGFFKRLGSFITAMIILTLYAEREEQHHHLQPADTLR